MKKFFYLVFFSYKLENGLQDQFDLGVFTSKSNAKKKIEMCLDLPGFKDFSKDNFTITKFAVSFEHAIQDKSKVNLYSVCHEYEDEKESDCYCWEIFGYFSTKREARKKIDFLKEHSRIGKKYPNNFEIVKELIDNYKLWSFGFSYDK